MGFCLQGQAIQDNYDLINMGARMLLVDWNFMAGSEGREGLRLDDGVNQLVCFWS